MKRVLMILTEFPPAIGGMQTHAILISKKFHKNGSKVEVYTYREMDDLEQAFETDKEFDFPVRRELTRVGYQRNLNVLEEAVKEFKPDLIYSSTVFYGILQDMTGVPVVCRSVGNDIMRPWIAYPFKFGRNIVSNYFIEKHLYKFFKKINKPEMVEVIFRKKRYDLTCKAAKAASIILANSKFTEDLLKDAGVVEKNVKRVVGGVDSSFFSCNGDKEALRNKLNLPPNRKILLTACRLVDKKGVDFLIRTMSKINGNGEDFHLVIVGDGRRKKRLINLSKELCVDDRVTFIGSVSYKEMPEFYWASDIFVLASTVFVDQRTGLRDAETMGRVLCEANAAGIPVIATDSGGIPSVIEHRKNGLLFPENDMEMLIQNINNLNSEDGLKNNLVENGFKISKECFDWENIMDIHETVFDQYI